MHAESNEKIQIAEANQKKQICNAMILKWKAKNILYGFRTWKNYVALCKFDTMKQDHEKTVLELKSKHDQANALHQEEINRIKANHENKIHELSQEIKQAKENHAAEIDSLSMVQKSTIDNIEQSKLNEVAVLNKLHAESNEKIQIAEANQKKQICNAMILKWKAKNILYGFRTWKNYVALCKVDTMKQDHEKTVLELKSKHDQANALHQEEINRIKANHENKIP